MSRFCVLMLACALVAVVPAFAEKPRQTADEVREVGKPNPEVLAAALKEKVAFDGNKLDEQPLCEVLQALAKTSKVTFVMMEEEFRARKVTDIKNKKSRITALDPKDLTVAELLDVLLPGYGATYRVHADYVAVVPMPVKAQEPNPAVKLPKVRDDPKPFSSTEDVLAVLTGDELNLGNININEVPLFELLQNLSKKYLLTFTINEAAFRLYGQPQVKEAKAQLAATQLRGLKIHQFLSIVLESMGATYLVKNTTIEIVPIQHAAKVTKAGLVDQDENSPGRLKEPLVSAIFKEKPLNEAVAKIAEMYDLTVTVLPQAGDARTGFVTARVLNTPADKALELLALQCDLRLVRRGTTYLITSKDHANELFEEGLDKERKKIEIQKLREAKPPAPEPAPAPKPPEK